MLLSYLYIPADKYWFLYLPTAIAVVGGGVGGASRAALPVGAAMAGAARAGAARAGAARAGAGERQERDLVLLLSRLRTPCSATSPIGSSSSSHCTDLQEPLLLDTQRVLVHGAAAAAARPQVLVRLRPQRVRHLGQCWRGYQETSGQES